MSLHKSNEKTIKKTNVRNIIAKQDSVVGSLSIYFQRKNDKTKVKTGQININSNWSFDKYLLEMKELEFQKSKENHEKEINLKKNQITNIIYN